MTLKEYLKESRKFGEPDNYSLARMDIDQVAYNPIEKRKKKKNIKKLIELKEEDGGDGSGTPAQGWGGDPSYTPNPPYGNYQPTQDHPPIMGKVTTKALRGYKRPHVLFTKNMLTKAIKSRIKKKNKMILFKEDLNLVKFKYTNWKHDPVPEVKILDYEYTKDGEKNNRKDLLGWNLNYYSNKQEAAKTIDDIDSFARLLSANNKEKYERVKYFFPDQAALIRRYKKDNVKNIKMKDGKKWVKTNFDELVMKHKSNF